ADHAPHLNVALVAARSASASRARTAPPGSSLRRLQLTLQLSDVSLQVRILGFRPGDLRLGGLQGHAVLGEGLRLRHGVGRERGLDLDRDCGPLPYPAAHLARKARPADGSGDDTVVEGQPVGAPACVTQPASRALGAHRVLLGRYRIMRASSAHAAIIDRAARTVLQPLGLRRKGRSRLWYDDQGWRAFFVEFQPSDWSKGT